MLVASFDAGPLAANCYLLAPGEGSACVVVDPGMGALDRLETLLEQHRLTPAAVLLTHGHLDHSASAAAVGERWRVPCWIHPDDRFMLTDPLSALPAEFRPLVVPPDGPEPSWAEPPEVVELGDGDRIELAGLALEVVGAPGHTRGSVLFRTGYPDDPSVDSLLLGGDVLFAGGVGRTDLPGGDPAAMLATLQQRVLTLPDTVVVLPGHGPQTTIARERHANPYLAA